MQDKKQRFPCMGNSVDMQKEMLRFEAIYWNRMIRKMGMTWWGERRKSIERRRGSEAVTNLLAEMRKQW